MATAQLFDEFDRRNWHRYVLDFDLTLTLLADGRLYAGRIEDISIGGLRLRLDGEAPTADSFVVEHPQAGSFKAQRAWQSETEIALKFDFVDALPLLLYCAISADREGDLVAVPKRTAASSASHFA